MDIDRFMEETRDAILDHGFVVQYADERSASFEHLPRAHTVGRALFNRPELLITGPFTMEQMHEMLEDLVAYDQEHTLALSQVVETSSRRFRIDLAEPSALIGALAAFGAINAYQAVWAQPDGTFPGQPQALRPPGV